MRKKDYIFKNNLDQCMILLKFGNLGNCAVSRNAVLYKTTLPSETNRTFRGVPKTTIRYDNLLAGLTEHA